MKKIKVIVIVIVVLAIIAAIAGGGSDDSTSKQTVTISSSGSESVSESSNESTNQVSYEITDTDFQYYTTSIGSIEYYGYVEITNTGSSNLYLAKAVFDLEDNDGHLLQSDSFISNAPAVLKPGEKGYFYNGLGSNIINESVDMSNGIKLVPQITVKKATGEPTLYEVVDTEIKEGNLGSPEVTGRVVNNTDKDCSYLYINIIFYDANGKVLAITGTSITDLSAGGKTSFDCQAIFMNDNATMEQIADYKIIAEETYIQF